MPNLHTNQIVTLLDPGRLLWLTVFGEAQQNLLQPGSWQRLYPGKSVSITFTPAVAELRLEDGWDGEHLLCNADTLMAVVTRFEGQGPDVHEPLVAFIQAISTLRHGRKKRDPQKPHSRGSKIKALEDSMANLDMQQGRAGIETFDGIQRIHGLAGSGRTHRGKAKLRRVLERPAAPAG